MCATIKQSEEFRLHFRYLCQLSLFRTKIIRKAGIYSDEDINKLLINYFVASRLVYCNSIFFRLAIKQEEENKQKSIASYKRYKQWMYHYVLKNLHWLPIKEIIILKTKSFFFQISAPTYLTKTMFIPSYIPPRALTYTVLTLHTENLLYRQLLCILDFVCLQVLTLCISYGCFIIWYIVHLLGQRIFVIYYVFSMHFVF